MKNEKIKNYVGWAIIVGIVALSLAALSYAKSYSESTDSIYLRTFGVTGEGKAVAVPDIAQFTFSVVTEGGQDIAALQQQNTQKVNNVIDFLKDSGVEAEDISTEGYSVEPRYQTCVPSLMGSRVCPPASIVGYTIRQTVAVKVRDLSKVGDILSGVISNGANSVSALQFTIDDPAQLEAEARAEAIDQAQAKAEATAEAGDFRLGRLISIEEGGYPQPYYGKMMDSATGMGGASPVALPAPTIEPGSQEIRVNVVLRYEID